MTLASLNLFDDVLMWYFLVVIPYVQRLLDFCHDCRVLVGSFFSRNSCMDLCVLAQKISTLNIDDARIPDQLIN